MGLLDRYRANECATEDCHEARQADAATCPECTNLIWRRELLRQPDGTYRRRRALAARDFTGAIRSSAA